MEPAGWLPLPLPYGDSARLADRLQWSLSEFPLFGRDGDSRLCLLAYNTMSPLRRWSRCSR